VIKEAGLDPAKVNPNGGAIALGHPLGCTGAKLTATIIRELKRRNGRYGMVTNVRRRRHGRGRGFSRTWRDILYRVFTLFYPVLRYPWDGRPSLTNEDGTVTVVG